MKVRLFKQNVVPALNSPCNLFSLLFVFLEMAENERKEWRRYCEFHEHGDFPISPLTQVTKSSFLNLSVDIEDELDNLLERHVEKIEEENLDEFGSFEELKRRFVIQEELLRKKTEELNVKERENQRIKLELQDLTREIDSLKRKK